MTLFAARSKAREHFLYARTRRFLHPRRDQNPTKPDIFEKSEARQAREGLTVMAPYVTMTPWLARHLATSVPLSPPMQLSERDLGVAGGFADFFDGASTSSTRTTSAPRAFNSGFGGDSRTKFTVRQAAMARDLDHGRPTAEVAPFGSPNRRFEFHKSSASARRWAGSRTSSRLAHPEWGKGTMRSRAGATTIFAP